MSRFGVRSRFPIKKRKFKSTSMFVQTSSNFGSTSKVYFAFVPLCFQPQQSVFDTEILILNSFLCYSIVKLTIRLSQKFAKSSTSS